MKKIKKVLLLLVAFSFTLLMFNSQAYAVEYYEFEFNITDVSNTSDIVYTSNYTYQEIVDFMVQYGTLSGDVYEYYITENEQYIYYYTLGDFIDFVYSVFNEVDFALHLDGTMEGGYSFNSPTVGIYTFTTTVVITFTQTFWDNIIDAIDEAAAALSSAASAGFGLIYDGVGLTALGSALVIPIGLGLVLGVFYLIIRMLPSVRL